jgi:hypothetical protein
MIVRRRSYGRDFGAWKDTWHPTRRFMPNTKEIILTNDILLGPLRPLSDLFRRLEAAEGDVVGSRDSWDRAYHLQSFFLLFRQGSGVASCDRFLRRAVPAQHKEMSDNVRRDRPARYLIRQDLRVGSVIRYEHVLRYVCSSAKMFEEFRFSSRAVLARVAQRTAMISRARSLIDPAIVGARYAGRRDLEWHVLFLACAGRQVRLALHQGESSDP